VAQKFSLRRSQVFAAVLEATGVDLKQPASGENIVRAIEHLELLRMGGAKLPPAERAS
jgi:hypothetical protein